MNNSSLFNVACCWFCLNHLAALLKASGCVTDLPLMLSTSRICMLMCQHTEWLTSSTNAAFTMPERQDISEACQVDLIQDHCILVGGLGYLSIAFVWCSLVEPLYM